MITASTVRPHTFNATVAQSPVRRALVAFFSTPQDSTGLILRLGLAITMFPHGAQKALGWFGGFGFEKTVGFFTQGGTPLPLTLAIIAAEFLGPIALVTGFFTRWSAFGIGLVMTGAALMVHSSNGFFMNWMGNQKGEGIEYFILAITLAVALIVKGGGRWSADRVIARKVSGDRK
ncbi:MAG: DoxX family protein [Fibrobacteres bacterium]|nr:DoxX family protein [Fibrobacterota bacterium]